MSIIVVRKSVANLTNSSQLLYPARILAKRNDVIYLSFSLIHVPDPRTILLSRKRKSFFFFFYFRVQSKLRYSPQKAHESHAALCLYASLTWNSAIGHLEKTRQIFREGYNELLSIYMCALCSLLIVL